jgi:hypothetical protein
MRSASGGADVPRRRKKDEPATSHAPDTAVFLRRQYRLDKATRDLYGCSFQQFVDAILRHGYDLGSRVAYKEGYAAGRRAAKGLPQARKKRGRSPKINESLRSLLLSTVEERKHGELVKDAVQHFLKTMRAGDKKLGTTSALPSDNQAIRAYYRARKKIPKNPIF